MATTIQNGLYGTNEVGKPYRSAEGTWFRMDTYRPYESKDAIAERRFCLDSADTSQVFHDGRNGKYHPRCTCCWLNFSHTLAYHNHSIDR